MVCACGTVFCCDNADQTIFYVNQQLYCSKSCWQEALREQKRLAACLERGKMPYPNVIAARGAATRQYAGHGRLLYPYLCPCGWWHLTKQPQPVPDEWEWFRVPQGDSPAFRNWLARCG